MHIKKFRNEYLALIISSIITLILFLKIDTLDYNHPHFKLYWDHHKYLWMALHNLDFHIAPFCWRIFVPFIASILPFEISINFKITSLLSVALTGFFVFKIGQKLFNETPLSFALMFACFSISYVSKFVIYDYWLPDAFAYLLITLSIYLILIKNDFLFLVVIILGALTKETVLFVLPLYYTFNATRFFDIKILKKTIIISILPLIIFIAVRILIPPLNDDLNYLNSIAPQLRIVQFDESTYNLKYLIHKIGLKRLNEFSLSFLYRITIYSFLIHFIFAFIGLFNAGMMFLKFLPFIILSYLQIFFAINEERLVVAAFIPIIVLSIIGQQKIFSRLGSFKIPILTLNLILLLTIIPSGLFYGSWLIIRQIFLSLVIYIITLVTIKIKLKYFSTRNNY